MISIEYIKKISIIDKVLEFLNKSNLEFLEYDLLEYENKYFEVIENFYNNNKNNIKEEIDKIKDLSDSIFRKYSRTIVRTNSNLENFVQTLSNENITFFNLEKLIEINKKIEDLMFDVEDTRSLNLKQTNEIRNSIKENRNFYFKLVNLKDVFSSFIVKSNIPSDYKDLEITFYTNDENIDSYSSRVLSFKLLYDVISRINNVNTVELILLKAEKEKNEYFKLAGLNIIIDTLYNLLRGWVKDYLESKSESLLEKEKLSFDKKIKNILGNLNKEDFEKYLEIIKKSLINLQIDKCSSVDIFSEEIVIENRLKDKEKNQIREITFNEKILQNKHETLRNIENSLLLKSSIPPANNLQAKEILEKGITLMSLRRYNEAIEYFNKAIEMRPNYAEAYNLKANAYIQNGQFNEAIALLDYAINLKPNYRDAYLNKGTALFSLKKIEDSIIQYKKVIEIDPNCHEAYFNLGSCFMMLPNKKKEAIKCFSKAIELKNDYPSAYYNRACAYCAEDDIENCIKDLEKVVKLDSNFKNIIKFDTDFSSIQDNERFKLLIG
jgi:tetratricopeptide (TPR) repeat protein